MRTERTIGRLISYSDSLRGRREHERADQVLAEAVLARPADAPDLFAALRGNLRVVVADRVNELVGTSPIDQRAAVTRALVEAQIKPDATALLDTICAEDEADVVRALALFDVPRPPEMWRAGAERQDAVDALCARLLSLSGERYISVLLRLFGEGLIGTGDRLARYLAVWRPLSAVDIAVDLAAGGQIHVSKILIDHVVDGVPPGGLAEILNRLSGDLDSAREVDTVLTGALIRRPDTHAVFQGLRFVATNALAERYLDLVAMNASAATIAALLEALLSEGAQTEAQRIVRRAATRTDRAELCDDLHRAACHRFAYLIAEQG